ncbi:acyl-CoA reductase [Chitinophaga lutea]|uniref:Acyl-CoA reductase n=1 Tax=Chitinophaga lutea TaxID=2488634 RepID=A0A3N4PAB9_9BACT|nr:acyl-CoA reductase [Chitinophaga lutea]RPE05592.1 acyl-CoA reductase [Chitinophaga lutea]
MIQHNISQKLAVLERLNAYLGGAGTDEERESLDTVKRQAYQHNGWFTPEFIDLSIDNIRQYYLARPKLEEWLAQYPGFGEPAAPKKVGIVMAGNIPLVGFHDWLTGFLSGHEIRLKLSSKDNILLPHLLKKVEEWAPELAGVTTIHEVLKDCDAYIATGSNNSARYFNYYFAKYPHIIRRNRTSAAVLTGEETPQELEALADDVMLYFGLGCRNVTKVYVPEGYDFAPLLEALKKYDYLADHHKYKNNYDYNLALYLLNTSPYLTNDSLLLHESDPLFSPLSVLHYGFYRNRGELEAQLKAHPDLQCLVARDAIPFGQAQRPSLTDYADGADTAAFFRGL